MDAANDRLSADLQNKEMVIDELRRELLSEQHTNGQLHDENVVLKDHRDDLQQRIHGFIHSLSDRARCTLTH